MTSSAFQLGIECALDAPHDVLKKARRFGLLCNQASTDAEFRNSHDLMRERFPGQLAALFAPQHGMWLTEQDNMIESAHGTHGDIPIHSLYSETRRPTDAMLEGLDLLVVDMQDVGTRVYTYAWTVLHCMEACAKNNIPVLVLDRPNPLGGEVAEGVPLDMDYASFVGLAPIPMRHGLTIGELAKFCNRELEIGCDLHVQPMRGYDRKMLWPDTGRAWVPPSPNLPRFEGVLFYPGQVLLEGTNLSEGRGTTTPFEQFGAPFIEPGRLRSALERRTCEGIRLRQVSFQPTFQKWHGVDCHGLFLHATEPHLVRSYRLTLTMMRLSRESWAERFAWGQPPYEYELERLPIQVLAGGDQVRAFVDGELPWSELDPLTETPSDWWQRATPCLLY